MSTANCSNRNITETSCQIWYIQDHATTAIPPCKTTLVTYNYTHDTFIDIRIRYANTKQ